MEKRKCTLLTLDVWDTIIRRKCYPDQIKIETAKRLRKMNKNDEEIIEITGLSEKELKNI